MREELVCLIFVSLILVTVGVPILLIAASLAMDSASRWCDERRWRKEEAERLETAAAPSRMWRRCVDCRLQVRAGQLPREGCEWCQRFKGWAMFEELDNHLNEEAAKLARAAWASSDYARLEAMYRSAWPPPRES